jgi:hypothetical protein
MALKRGSFSEVVGKVVKIHCSNNNWIVYKVLLADCRDTI